MSWSKQGLYATVPIAISAITDDPNLPAPIKQYIIDGLKNWQAQDAPVEIIGQGHVCTGSGSYETTSCQLTVTPKTFATK